ncbi:unnamed protein product [Microthlaspi erraticum]|uniref:F-box domain-containing protein n=1 Tax=Microthlaspi erraticum TaxID=1685480 RepID=A0A6D2IKJ3_9BRAS|nr:unnamed protein product [Microthlaspi erraticum]
MDSSPVPSMDSSPIPSMDSSLLSDARGKRRRNDLVQNVDRISKLPDHVLLVILGKLSTEEAIQTSKLSTRWEGVWKQIPNLNFDMKKTNKHFNGQSLAHRSGFIAELITKVINNHDGDLECCEIKHFPYQWQDGTLETWIQTLIHVKSTKDLSLINCTDLRWRRSVLHLPPNTFSHPTLTSLLLRRYDLEAAHAFNNCRNLTILNLVTICAEVGVFNAVIASCPSLKVLLLDIEWNDGTGCLEIKNSKLKILHLACNDINSIEVTAPLLDFFSVDFHITRSNLTLIAPRLLQLTKNCWTAYTDVSYISYNISCDDQVKGNIESEFIVSKIDDYLPWVKCLAVSVDLTNPKEVNMLHRVLTKWDKWGRKIKNLKIFFKQNNGPKQEGESSILEAQQKKWNGKSSLFSIDIRVEAVWLYNFSGLNKEEFELVSSLTQRKRKATKKVMIKTLSIPENKKLEIEAAMAKLMKLSKGRKKFSVNFF